MPRQLTYGAAIHEAIDLCLEQDSTVYLMGLGVPDPKGVFGTTLGLQAKFGASRVLDMPTAENGMTGVAIGSALVGMKPIMVHQRMDFALMAIDQIVNQAANWHYMFGGKQPMPLVIRMIIGRGWGQGPQHSQSLQAWFGHIPGLKVVMPATPYDAKGLMIASVEDNNPVIFLEHRWLHGIVGPVPEGRYQVPIGRAHIYRQGTDITIAATSYMTLEAYRASEALATKGISAEVVDIRTVRPLDTTMVLDSVRKTGRLLVVDTGWKTLGLGAEVLAQVSEQAFSYLKCAPQRIGLPDSPSPSTPALAENFYPTATHVVLAAAEMVGANADGLANYFDESVPLDVPNQAFTGPF